MPKEWGCMSYAAGSLPLQEEQEAMKKQTIDGVPREFVREGRYIVVKPDYEDDLRTERLRNYIEEMCFHTPDCVVVEADWPEYEKVWGMIEARVTGRQTELDSALATIAHLRDDLDGTRLLAADQLLKINRLKARISELEAAQPQAEPVALDVWYGPMPETNGKTNWTAILHRKGECWSEGITIDRSEYPDRVRYEADRMLHLIGALEDEPNILAYDPDKHSGYVKAEQPAPVAVGLPVDPERERLMEIVQ